MSWFKFLQLGNLQICIIQVVNHPAIKTHLTSTLLDMVSKERRGEIVDRSVVKIVTREVKRIRSQDSTLWELARGSDARYKC